MNMQGRTLPRSLFIQLILKRRGSVRRFQRMKMEENVAEELVQLVDFEEEG
jgi:hypothetical protein